MKIEALAPKSLAPKVALTRGESNVFVVRANGGPPRRLLSEASAVATWPSWSGDGQSIYFRADWAGRNEIWKIRATGGKAVQVTRNGGEPDLPGESSDGKYLYYVKNDHYPEQCSVWRMPKGGGQETRVLEATACVSGFAIGNQGIYFLSPVNKENRSTLSLYDLSTGKTRTVLPSIEPLPWPDLFAVSPDGQTILYAQADEAGADLMLVDNFH